MSEKSKCCGERLIKHTILYGDGYAVSGRDGGYICYKCHQPVNKEKVLDLNEFSIRCDHCGKTLIPVVDDINDEEVLVTPCDCILDEWKKEKTNAVQNQE
jgi:DNA-directed RNA polymerase subunit RPC12/RpoP